MTVIVDIDKENLEKIVKKIGSDEKSKVEDYIKKLIGEDIDHKVELGEGIYYDRKKEAYYHSSQIIDFTKTQKNMIELLLSNRGKVVDVETIKKNAWPNKNNVSIHTLRNMVKAIRDKTHYGIIQSHNAKGYSIP